MVTVIKQPRWAFLSYEEAYEFNAAVPTTSLLDKIVAFYSKGRLRGLVRDSSELRFSRGSVLGSLFIPSERFHKQNVSIRISELNGGTKVLCHYSCWDPYPNYHIPPRMLQREVQELECFVQGHKAA